MNDSRSSPIVGGAIWAVGSRIFQTGVTALAIVLLARLLGPGEMGSVFLILSLVALLALFADLGMSSAVARRILESEREVAHTIRSGILAVSILMIGVAATVLLLSEQLGDWLDAPEIHEFRWLLVGLISVTIAHKFISKAFEGLRKVAIASRIVLATGWMPWGIALAAGVTLSARANAILTAQFVGHFLVVLALGAGLYQLVPRAYDRKPPGTHKRLFRYAGPMIATTASFYIYTHSDILLIQKFLGSDAVGVYGAAVRLLEMLHVPAAAIGTAVATHLVAKQQQDPAGAKALFQNVTRWILIAYLPIALVLLLLSTELVTLVFGAEYLVSATILTAYLPFLVLKSLSATYSLALDYGGFAGRRAIAMVISALANIVLNIYMIPRYGLIGAAVATQLTYIPLVIWYAMKVGRSSHVTAAAMGGPLLRIASATFTMGAVILFLERFGNIHVLLVLLLAAAVYATALFASRACTLNDFQWMRDMLQRRRAAAMAAAQGEQP